MRILFVNHAFPGMFGALAAHFAAAGHEVLFASGFRRRDFSLPGVRHIVLPAPRESRSAGAMRHAPGLEAALGAGGQALTAFRRLADMGLAPDMALLSANDGYGLFCGEAFPRAFCVGWAEALPDVPGAEARGEPVFTRHLLQCRYAVCCHALVCPGTGEAQPLTAPLAHGLNVPYAVNTQWFSPVSAEGPELVLFHAGRKGPDAHAATLVALLHARGHCRAAVLCEGRTAWESWQAALPALPHRDRLHLPGMLSLEDYRNLLRAASLLICPHQSGLPAAILLEAMSCGVVPLLEEGSGPAFLHHGQNAFFCRGQDASLPAALLEARAPRAAARAGARRTVLARFNAKMVVPRHARLLLQTYNAWKIRDTPRH